MAKILNYYHLCPINDENEFLGLSQDSEPGTVLNTIGKNIIISVKLSNQKQLNSWAVLDKLSSKVVFDFHSKSYVGVFSHKWIRCWKADCTEINKIKRIKLAKPIHSLISIPHKNTIVLFSDGTCESLDSAIECRKEKKDLAVAENKAIIDEETTKILEVNYFKISDDKILLTYFTETTNGISLVYFELDSETLKRVGTVHQLALVREDKSPKLTGYTVVESSFYPKLVTIWCDGRIFLFPLQSDRARGEEVPGHFVSMLNAIKVDQPLSVIGISRDCIAIYGASTSQEGASLVLYNLQFKVIGSKQQFKIYFNNSRMWVIDKFIFLAVSQTLAVVTFRISNEQLSDMIGSQRLTDLSASVDTECINVDGELEQELEFDAEKQFEANALDESEHSDFDDDEFIHPTTKDYCDGKTSVFEDDEMVERDLRRLQRYNLDVAIERDDKLLPNMVQLTISSNVNDSTFSTEPVRCLIKELQQAGASEYEISDCVVPLLIESNQENDILTCLRTYSNISEKAIALALNHFVKLARTNETENLPDDVKVDSDYTRSINAVLSCSFNREHILDHLRSKLDLNEVLYLLTHIFTLLESNDVQLEERPQNECDFGDDELLIKWAITLIDSHFQQFIILRDTKLIDLLSKWKQFVDALVSDIEQSKSISAILYNLINGKPINKESKTSKWYSVEAFKLY